MKWFFINFLLVLASIQAFAYSPQINVDVKLNSYKAVLDNTTVRDQIITLDEQGYNFDGLEIVAQGRCLSPMYIFAIKVTKYAEGKNNNCSFSVRVGSCEEYGTPGFDPTKLEVKEIEPLEKLRCVSKD